MPNAYMSGIAQGMNKTPQDQAFGQTKNTPWSTPEYDPVATGTFSRTAHGYQIPHQVGDVVQNYGGRGTAKWMNGPQGFGVYRTPNTTEQLLGAEQYGAQQFQAGLPDMEAKMGNQLAGQVGAQTDSAAHSLKVNNSNRGLLYGGIHAGQEGQIRAAGAAQVAQGRSNINQGLLDQSNKMAQGAIQTGYDWQQEQQRYQDAIYAKALANLSGVSQVMGGVGAAAGAVIGGIYSAGAGTGVGAAAGAGAGNALGRAL